MYRYIIVINESDKQYANEKIGENTFTVGLSADGTEPITHYWCNWNMTQETYNFLQENIGDIANFYNAENWTPDEVLAEESLQRIQNDEM